MDSAALRYASTCATIAAGAGPIACSYRYARRQAGMHVYIYIYVRTSRGSSIKRVNNDVTLPDMHRYNRRHTAGWNIIGATRSGSVGIEATSGGGPPMRRRDSPGARSNVQPSATGGSLRRPVNDGLYSPSTVDASPPDAEHSARQLSTIVVVASSHWQKNTTRHRNATCHRARVGR